MTVNNRTLELARDVIQMLGAPSPLHFSKEEIIKWQECNAAIDSALMQTERHGLQARGEHPAPCARFCEANAFRIAERGYMRRIAELEAKLKEKT